MALLSTTFVTVRPIRDREETPPSGDDAKHAFGSSKTDGDMSPLVSLVQGTRLDRFEQNHDRYTKTALPQVDVVPVVNTRIIGVTQATTLRPDQDLVCLYPAILEQNFYTAELADDHQIFSLSDYHYTEGMVYKAPPVLDHAEVTLSQAAKKHDADLASVQTRMAHHTRFYDTFASDILERKWETSEPGKAMLQFLNTMRIAAANDAAKISQLRSKLYYNALGIKHEPAKEGSILKVEDVAARKAASDLIRTVYATPTVPKATNNDGRTKKQDGGKGSWQQKSSGSNDDKSNDQSSSFKKKKNNNNQSGNKSSSGSSNNFKKKKPEQGNEGEESD
ncbi:hypothetical protein BGZ96_002754 [Linnemannia gamsii]|uniref:Uncharacterized protein n=1 Tax=Linnemannia gamsii TaxID=64522 RepID=A0ABQ7JKN5_9FUNG|nr:hypothetical protein BGZ96_002754 [Linnemannia gamsii]